MKPGVSIHSVAYVLPNNAVTNEQLLAQHPDWRIRQLEERTGVKTRHIAAAGETALDLAYQAAFKLLSEQNIDPQTVDGLILCTQSPEYIMPPGSCLLQERLGLSKKTACFDFNLACSGFVYGLGIAKGLILGCGLKRVILVTADTYSRYIHPQDRSLVVLFGDGAAATCITASNAGEGHTVEDVKLYTDGTHAAAFRIPAGGARIPCSPETKAARRDRVGNIRTDEHIHMLGKEILDFVLREIPPALTDLVTKNGTSLGDVDLFLLHQASKISLDMLIESMNLPSSKVFMNLERVGNTVSSSIPILMRDALDEGALQPEMRVMIAGFGVGLSWGCCLLKW